MPGADVPICALPVCSLFWFCFHFYLNLKNTSTVVVGKIGMKKNSNLNPKEKCRFFPLLRIRGILEPDSDLWPDPDSLNMDPNHSFNRTQIRQTENLRWTVFRIRIQLSHKSQSGSRRPLNPDPKHWWWTATWCRWVQRVAITCGSTAKGRDWASDIRPEHDVSTISQLLTPTRAQQKNCL